MAKKSMVAFKDIERDIKKILEKFDALESLFAEVDKKLSGDVDGITDLSRKKLDAALCVRSKALETLSVKIKGDLKKAK